MTTDKAMVTDALQCVEKLSKDIVRAVCELDYYPDPSSDDTLMITADDLEAVVHRHITAAVERAALTLERGEAEPVMAEYERREAVCTETAMSQWERSLKRPDMAEKDRVRGALEAYKRQAFAFTMLPSTLSKRGEAEETPAPHGCHPSHTTRSSDASSYDEVCTKCGATDIAGGGWEKLAEPCLDPAPETHLRGDE